jgi:hypothetical protein
MNDDYRRLHIQPMQELQTAVSLPLDNAGHRPLLSVWWLCAAKEAQNMIIAAPTYAILKLDDGWFVVLRRVAGGVPAENDPATTIATRSGRAKPARFPPDRRVEAEAFIYTQQLADKAAASRLQVTLSASANPNADERAAVVRFLRSFEGRFMPDEIPWDAIDAIERGDHHPYP